MTSAFILNVSPQGIAEIKFDLPHEKVNKFSLKELEELEKILDDLSSQTAIKAVKLTSGKENIFIAGADLHSFEPAFEDPSIAQEIIHAGQRVFKKLENLPFPSVAVIHGSCLGGGTECALSCTYRIVSDHPKTQIGLPEVNLGIFPGWGGTQRLPRLVGLTEGLTLVVSGKSIPAMKAWKIHLADAIYPWEFIEEKTGEFIASILTKEGKQKILKRRKERNLQKKLLENNPLGRYFLFSQTEKNILDKTKGHYPAPLLALHLIKETYTLSLNEGLTVEAEKFTQNISEGFKIAKDLIRIFFTQEALKKELNAISKEQAHEVSFAGVLGAGTMGASIAWLLAEHKIQVRLKDLSWEFLGKGLAVIRELLLKALKNKKISSCEADRSFQLISGTVNYSGFEHADLVIEAATENLELKRKIFEEVEKALSKNAIIASNTSSLTIDAMAQSLKFPERFVGMHFFNPVHKMPLVEVVAGKHTQEKAIASAVSLCRKLGKTPMVVSDCPGFLVNRIFITGANEVMLMCEEGFSFENLEQAIIDFGMPMSPFELADEVGIDVIYKVGEVFEKAYGERMHPSELVKQMVNSGWYGKKNGKGFYLYKKNKREINKEIYRLIDRIHRKKMRVQDEVILPRFLYSMINEAARCLEEKVIHRPDYLDLALILGTGFPPFQGGLLRYADHLSLSKIYEDLNLFTEKYGMRFSPCRLIEKMAQENLCFYHKF